ncbi:hypothetical protein [Nostoc sp. PA-18-2419]|nr:hypothetical protein [Nostoc sp. PA-18-2419]
MNKPQYTDPTFEQFFVKIAPEVVNSFTVEQLEAIKRSFSSRVGLVIL